MLFLFAISFSPHFFSPYSADARLIFTYPELLDQEFSWILMRAKLLTALISRFERRTSLLLCTGSFTVPPVQYIVQQYIYSTYVLYSA